MSNPRASSVVTLRDRTYPAIVALIVGLFRLLRFRMTVVGAQHIPLDGGAVLAANHTGFLDFCFVGEAARKKKRLVRFMCKREVFDNPLGGPVMRSMHHIPVDRDAGSGAFGVALKYLRSGELVGIFPEGSISRSFEPMSFMPGATALAAGASVPLIPMAVWGSQRIWTKATFRALRLRRIPVTIICGEPMTFERREDHAAEYKHAAFLVKGKGAKDQKNEWDLFQVMGSVGGEQVMLDARGDEGDLFDEAHRA